MALKTAELVSGDQVQLIGFGMTEAPYRHRLLSFGLTPGVDVKVVRRAPMGCPIQLQVRGTDLMLRASEAASLTWERV